MFNRTQIILELLQKRAKVHQGAHSILSQGYNYIFYLVAITLSFFVFYHIVNKLVYNLTDTQYILNLCIQKHMNKLKNKKRKDAENFDLEIKNENENVKGLLFNEDVNIDTKPVNNFNENNLKDSPEVKYNLWFYRFSIMDCIHNLLTFPLLISVFINFDKIHDDETYVYISWDTYIIQCMMVGHYLKDIDELFSHGYVKRSRDLMLHHLIALIVFIGHSIALMNFRWISIILFLEINSFFLRSNLVLKFHDPSQKFFLWNINCLFNLLTIVFVRFAILIRYFVYDLFHNWDKLTVVVWYTITIYIIAIAMTYLSWTSFIYIILTDVPKLKEYLRNKFNFVTF